jgi:hypothetical protein
LLLTCEQAFRPAGSIDLDEKAAALGSITLDARAVEEYELEFPDLGEDDMNQYLALPETDDNLLSLHNARREAIQLMPPARSTSMGSDDRGSDFGDFLRHPLQPYDLLDGQRSESLEAPDFMRGGADEAASATSAREGLGPSPFGLEHLDFGKDAEHGGVSYPGYEIEMGAMAGGPSDEFGDYHHDNLLDYGPQERLRDEGSISGLDLKEIPAAKTRAKTTFSQLMDRNGTHLPHEQLKERLTNPAFNLRGQRGERALAPATEQELKRAKRAETKDDQIRISSLLSFTAKPLRSLMKDALAMAARSRPVTAEPSVELSFDQGARPGDHDIEMGAMAGGYESPEETRGGAIGAAPSLYSEDYNHEDNLLDYGQRPSIIPTGEEVVSFGPKPTKTGRVTGEPISREASLELPETGAPTFTSSASSSVSEQLSANAHSLLSHYHGALLKKFPSENVSTHQLSFQTEFSKTTSRAHVARNFLSLLELKTKDYIQLEQPEPYGEISFSFLQRTIPPRPSTIGA